MEAPLRFVTMGTVPMGYCITVCVCVSYCLVVRSVSSCLVVRIVCGSYRLVVRSLSYCLVRIFSYCLAVRSACAPYCLVFRSLSYCLIVRSLS